MVRVVQNVKGFWGRAYVPGGRRLETHYQDGLGKTEEALKQKVDKWPLDVLSHHVFCRFPSAWGDACVCV